MISRLFIEKRRKRRLNVLIFVDIYEINSDNRINSGVITNISTGGMQIETKEEIKKKAPFNIRFVFPNGAIFDDVYGRIIRNERDGMVYAYGIRFTEIKLRDKLRIWWFIKTFKRALI